MLSLVFILGFCYISMNGYAAIITALFEAAYLRHAKKDARGWRHEVLIEYTTDDVLHYILPTPLYEKVSKKRRLTTTDEDDEMA